MTITPDQATVLNKKMGSLINRNNPLGLTDNGLPASGIELTASVTGTLRRLQAISQRAQAAGRATPQAMEILAKVEAVFAEYGIK